MLGCVARPRFVGHDERGSEYVSREAGRVGVSSHVADLPLQILIIFFLFRYLVIGYTR